ncbi:MAG TPA: helix-turn-helix transcriptional regulator [Candidatus Dormibacteraeota bacterium]|nr:helix-turn-helix transcriptional regulator [Candidatus Dormibacteraeota bacterium]
MLGSRYRGRRKGIRIREGSVREARHEAGLSLADIARDQVSRTAIHLIEHGRVNPSLETLQHIARRTRKPVSFFLLANSASSVAANQPRLQELERLTLARDFEAVLAVGIPLLGKKWSKGDVALLRFYVGQAYCRLVRPDEAIEHLRAARKTFEAQNDEWSAVEALDWEASALGLLESADAMPMANDALDRCRKLNPRPPQIEARILGHIANLHVVRHAWSDAMRYYEAAVEAAGKVKDLLQQAKMHHGLGNAYRRIGQPVRARQHFDRALALYSLESDLSAVYRVENDLGDLLLQEGQLDAAEEHLTRALTGCDELHIDRRGRGFVLNGLGNLHIRRGNLDRAAAFLADAQASGEASGERLVVAEAHSLRGELQERRGKQHEADGEFAAAIAILEHLDMPDRLRDAHMDYAEILDARCDLRAAADHWRAAAEISKSSSASGRRVATRETQMADQGAGTA